MKSASFRREPCQTRDDARTLRYPHMVGTFEPSFPVTGFVDVGDLLRAIADQSPALSWFGSTPDRREWFNRSWLAFVGRSPEEEIGTAWALNLHPEDRASHAAACAEGFASRRGFSTRVRLRRHDGRHRILYETASPLQAPDGSFAGMLGACVDVTEIAACTASEGDEHRMRERAEERLREREDLISTVVHDLRTPLNTMLGWVRLLRTGIANDPRQLEEGLGAVERSARLQSRLVTEFADASRLASGKARLARRPVSLRGVVSAAVEALAPSARVEQRLPKDDVRVDADPDRLEKALSSLLARAAHLGREEQPVELAAERAGPIVEIRIARDGSAVSTGANRRTSDLGDKVDVEAFVVRSVLELHGGTLRTSEDGARSSFIVTLPVA